MSEQKTYRTKNSFGKETVYKIVDSINDVPLSHKIWNIGRHNFPLEGYIPMARVTGYSIHPETLLAVPVESEERALYLLDLAHKKDFDAMDIRDGKV